MDQSSSTKILGKLGFAILVISLVDLVFINWWVIKKEKDFAGNQAQEIRAVENTEQKANIDDIAIKEETDEPSPSPEVTGNGIEEVKVSTSTKTEPVVQTTQKEIFITLGSGLTKSNSYAELAGLEVTIDPSKYSVIDSIVFEASLWVDGGNGRAWAQLYVVDDKNPLIESQISNPTSTGVLKSSGKIPIPSDSKTFRVQAKTDIVEYAAHVENARIKITLK